MSYQKVNSNTWIEKKGNKEVDLAKYDKSVITDFGQKKSKPKKVVRQDSDYQDFINEIFKERSFISTRVFNQEIKKKFNSSFSYYKNKMFDLGLITEKNGMIKPVKK